MLAMPEGLRCVPCFLMVEPADVEAIQLDLQIDLVFLGEVVAEPVNLYCPRGFLMTGPLPVEMNLA